MIPFATPRDGEIVNLNNVICCKQISPDECRVTFSDGETRIYKDQAARIMNAEFMFHVQAYRAYGAAMQEAQRQAASLIVPALYSTMLQSLVPAGISEPST